MLQTIRHGSKIDAATPAEVEVSINRAVERRSVEMYERKKGVIQLDANGAGDTNASNFAPTLAVPAQFDWRMERVTIVSSPAAAALVLFYENNADAADLLEVIQLGTVGMYSDSFDNSLYVPANSQVVIVVTGGTANGQLAFNLQLKLVQHPKR